MVVHAEEVGVRMIAVPVEWVGFHLEVVAGKVAWRVAQVVVLVPQHPTIPRGRRNHHHSDG